MLKAREVRQEETEKIGAGFEKNVYGAKRSEKRGDFAVGVYKEKEHTPTEVKGRFYLTKLMSALYPENVIDIHESSTEPNAVVMDKVDFVGAQKDWADFKTEKKIFRDKDDRDVFRRLNKKELEGLRDESQIPQKFREAGYFILDTSTQNYGEDKKGNILYCDTIEPWKVKGWVITKLFDEEKLAGMIEMKLEDEKKKKKALHYLERLTDLLEQEKQAIKDKYKREAKILTPF